MESLTKENPTKAAPTVDTITRTFTPSVRGTNFLTKDFLCDPQSGGKSADLGGGGGTLNGRGTQIRVFQVCFGFPAAPRRSVISKDVGYCWRLPLIGGNKASALAKHARWPNL